MRRPYTRSLHPDDYAFLAPYTDPLYAFRQQMAAEGVPHREWHPHRFWEYASILQQLDELGVPTDAELVDVGSGGCFFAPYLAGPAGYANLALTDSMKYGDVTAIVAAQRARYGVSLALHDLPCEDMTPLDSGRYDVTMCISTVEHVDDHDAALRELWRITKPGGYLFLTSDYFRDLAQFEQSVSRHLQVTPYREEFVLALPTLVDVDFVGGTDLGYQGDFVHNYSFVNICLRKRAASTSASGG